jgi:hypothetical protein
MSKGPQFRILNRDIEKYNKLKKSVYDFRYRFRQKYGVAPDIYLPKIKEFATRKEYNKAFKQIQNALQYEYPEFKQHFTNKYNQKLPLDLVEYRRKETKRINQLRAERVKEINKTGIIYKGRRVASVEEMWMLGDSRYDQLKPLKFDPHTFRSKNDFLKYIEKMKKFEGDYFAYKDQTYRKNWLESFEDLVGRHVAGTPQYRQLLKHIEDMDLNDFMTLYYSKKLPSIGYLYDHIHAGEKVIQIANNIGLKFKTPRPKKAKAKAAKPKAAKPKKPKGSKKT